MKKLNELSDGSCGRVVAINGDAHFQSRVTSIGDLHRPYDWLPF